MNHSFQRFSKKRSEIIKLDVHIAENEKITFTIDMMSCNLQKTKKKNNRFIRNLILENNYLRQEIVYYKKSRKTMIIFNNNTLNFFQLLQTALKKLSHKMTTFEKFMLKYWKIDVNKIQKNDVIVFWIEEVFMWTVVIERNIASINMQSTLLIQFHDRQLENDLKIFVTNRSCDNNFFSNEYWFK